MRLLDEQVEVLESSVALIDASLLPDNQKAQYEQIIRKNTKLLK